MVVTVFRESDGMSRVCCKGGQAGQEGLVGRECCRVRSWCVVLNQAVFVIEGWCGHQ